MAVRLLLPLLVIIGLTGCYQRTTVPSDQLEQAFASCPQGEFESALIRPGTEIEVDPDAGLSSRPRWVNFCDGAWRDALATSQLQEYVLRRHVPGQTVGLVVGATLGTALFIAGTWWLFITNL